MRDKLVLLADNKDDFRNTRAEFLERAGFRVLQARSVSEATSILQSAWLHVAVLDIRLRNDDDPDDTSGLELAKTPSYRHIPKVILTAFPSYEYVRTVLGPSLDGLPSAVNFISKAEDPQAMIDAVQEAFLEYLGINWDLVVHWGERCLWTFANLAALLTPDADAIRLADQANELEDLLRRLFFKSDQITLDRVFWRTDGRLAFSILAYAQGIPDKQAVVTCGRIDLVSRERENLVKLGLSAPSAGNPHLVNYAETLRFGANCYELVGSNLETIKTFDEFFSQGTTREVNASLDRLVQTCLQPWHRQSKLTGSLPQIGLLHQLRSVIGNDDDLAVELAERVESVGREAAAAGLVGVEIDGANLILQFPKGRRHVYPDPSAWITNTTLADLSFPTLHGTTLNALGVETILVDSGGQPWLTDYGDVAERPLLADYAALETAIKFDLVDDAITLEDLHELESALLTVSRLNQKLDPGSQQFSKVVSAVQRVRQNAASACGPGIQPYYWELLSHSAKRVLAYEPGVRRTRRELLPLVHACMSMGMICAKLGEGDQATSASATPGGGIEINEANQQVQVDGRLISMTPTEFAVMLFLWRHPGQLCSREAIVLSAYGHEYTPGKLATDDAKLGVVIDRIREKIEVDPGAPKYLVTKRGAGYILYPLGSSA